MKISIIIPCYNSEKFITTTLDSVSKQTLNNWECIIIDDGSIDNSKNVILKYIQNDERYIYEYQENKGTSDARNKGINIATGSHLFFLDSDDLIPIDALENLSSYIDHDIDIVFGKTAITYDQNYKTIDYLDHNLPVLKKLSNNSKQLISSVIEDNMICTAHNRLYKTSFIQKNNLKFKSNLLHEDELWFFETLFFSENIFLNDKTTYYYNVTNNDSIMNNISPKNIKDYLSIVFIIYNKYYLNIEHSKYSNEIALHITRSKQVIFYFYNFLSAEEKKLVNPFIKQNFNTIQPKRTKQLVSKKMENRFYKFHITTFLPIEDLVTYHNRPKGLLKKVNRKILFYKTFIKNYKTIKATYQW